MQALPRTHRCLRVVIILIGQPSVAGLAALLSLRREGRVVVFVGAPYQCSRSSRHAGGSGAVTANILT